MTHEQVQALLTAYALGELTHAERREAEAHLAQCSDCRDQLAGVQALAADLAGLDQEAPLPQAFQTGWREAVKEEADQMLTNKQSRRRSWRGALAAAAAVVFLVGGTLLTRDSLTGSKDAGRGAALPQAARSLNKTDGFDYGLALGDSAAYDEEAAPREAPYGMESGVQAQEQAAKIIKTLDVSLRTTDFEGDYAGLQALCESLGGWVEYAYQSGDAQQGELRRGSLTLRIPSSRLAEAKAQLSQTGRLVSLSESAQDVSASYDDTQTRLQTQREKLARLEKLMGAAENVSDLVEIENAIAETQYQIDAYESRLKQTDRQVDYSSVTVSLREERAAETAQTAELPLSQRLGAGLRASWEAMGAFLRDLAVFLAASAPWLLALGAAVGLAWLLRKGLKRRK